MRPHAVFTQGPLRGVSSEDGRLAIFQPSVTGDMPWI